MSQALAAPEAPGATGATGAADPITDAQRTTLIFVECILGRHFFANSFSPASLSAHPDLQTLALHLTSYYLNELLQVLQKTNLQSLRCTPRVSLPLDTLKTLRNVCQERKISFETVSVTPKRLIAIKKNA